MACGAPPPRTFRELLSCLEAEHARLEDDFAALQARHTQLLERGMHHVCADAVAASGPPRQGEGEVCAHRDKSSRIVSLDIDVEIDAPTLLAQRETDAQSEWSPETGSEYPRYDSGGSFNTPVHFTRSGEESERGEQLHSPRLPDLLRPRAVVVGQGSEYPLYDSGGSFSTVQLTRSGAGAEPPLPSPRGAAPSRRTSSLAISPRSTGRAETSSLGASLALWPDWVDINEGPDPSFPKRHSTNSSIALPPPGALDAPRSGDTLSGQTCLKPLMLAPSSARKICWDMMSFFLMGYDILMIPMGAFTMPDVEALAVMDWVVTLFWTCDIILTFFVGFYDGGILDMRPCRVARRYFRSWFLPDVLVVGVDWLVIALGDNTAEGNALGVLRIGKSVRILRVLRMFRLLRILKVLSTLEEISDFVHSESLHTGLNIVKLVVAIAVVNHFIACGWYAIGTLDMVIGDLEDAWVRALEAELGGKVPLGYSYSTSLHWSLTQFTPASMEVVPRNSIERSYAIAVILLALVMFSSFVSSITSAMTHLRALREEQRRQQENVRRYISENKLSMELGNRVHAFIRQHHKMAKARVRENDIAVFRYLPEHLRFQMRCEVYAPTLDRHPLFAHVAANDSVCMARICHTAASQEALLVGEELFHLGQVATKMFFVTSGNMEYQHHSSEGAPNWVEAGARISEIVLWAQWEHQGRLLAVQTSELVAIDSAKFRSIARRRVQTSIHIAEYAAEYVVRLSHAFNDNPESMSDIWDDGECIDDLATHSFGEELTPVASSHMRRKRTALPADLAEAVSNAGVKLRAALH